MNSTKFNRFCYKADVTVQLHSVVWKRLLIYIWLLFMEIHFMICYLIIHFLQHNYNSFTDWISFVVEVRHNMRCNHFSYHCLSVNNKEWLINQTRKIVGCKTCHNNVKSDRFNIETHAKKRFSLRNSKPVTPIYTQTDVILYVF